MKIKSLFVLLIMCLSLVVSSCILNENGSGVLSSDTTFELELINGKEVDEQLKLHLTNEEWLHILNEDLLDIIDYDLAEKATLNVFIFEETKEIHFVVTAEDGTKKTTIVKVELLSNNTSLEISSIDGINIVDLKLLISKSKWEELKNSDIKAKTVYTLAEKAALEVSVDEENRKITYLVTAEDGTTSTQVIAIDLLSNDTSLEIFKISTNEVIGDSVIMSNAEWNALKTSDVKNLSTYTLAEKAALEVFVDEENKKITYLVTAEDGTTSAKNIFVNLLSCDTSIAINSICGVEVVDGVVKLDSLKWAELETSNVKEQSVYELAEKAIVEVTVDKENKEIVYSVTAEDGTSEVIYVEVTVLEIIHETNVTLTAQAENKEAKSYWFAEYTEKGIKITVDVLDSVISTSNSNFGYNDNIEFIISQKNNSHFLSTKYDYKVLVDSKGNYFFQKAIDRFNYGYSGQIEHASYGLVFGETFTCSSELMEYTKGSGYRVSVFIDYRVLGTNEAEALGNLTISPAMRNTNNNGSTWSNFSELSCVWQKSYTYLGIEEDGTFVDNVKKYYSNVDYLFIGDSWMDVWFWPTFEIDFSNYNAINIGIGGTKGEDWVARLDLIKQYNPKNLILRIGTNDINTGQTGESAGVEIVELCKLLHANLPNMHIYFLSIDPCIGHFVNWTNGRDAIANGIIEEFAATTDYLTYKDFTEKLIDEDGNILTSMYCRDTCHLSEMGYATYVKVMYEMLGLPWIEGTTFGDCGKFSHTLGFSSNDSDTTSNTSWGEQHTYFKDFTSKELYAEFEVTAEKVHMGDAWPKFGIRMTNGNLSLALYVDAYAGLNGNYVGAVLRRGCQDYDWNDRPVADANVNMSYTNGQYVRVGVLRTNGTIYFFINDVCALSFADCFDDTNTSVGAFAFNTSIKIKNAKVYNDADVIAEKLAQAQ